MKCRNWMNVKRARGKCKIDEETLISYIDKVISGELSGNKAAKLYLRPNAQGHHFIEKARALLARKVPTRLQAFNERLEANKPHIEPEVEEKVVAEYLAGATQTALIKNIVCGGQPCARS